MSTTLTYLFDPLCGWCYGASPAIQQLGQQSAFTLELAPTGLFAGTGRTVDAAFAAYAWSNDQRIAQLTGQAFTEDYRLNVLGRHGSRFDSAAMTLALTAVSLTEPARELATLKALQEARYVRGLDTADDAVVGALLRGLGLTAAANLLMQHDAALVAANAARIRQAQALMHSLGLQGVPALVVADEKGRRVLRGEALYGGYAQLLEQIAAA
jgi:putative protein-disulfide isomerase